MRRARRSLSAVVRRAGAEGRLAWLSRAAWRALRLRLGRPLRAPLFATLAVTYRCNYRCLMCDLPLRAGQDPTTDELLGRVRDLADGGVLAIGITGGEPLLHPGLFEVIDAGVRRGLWMHLNTNGSHLTATAVPRLLASGLHSLNVSLDGAEPATHDELRRAPGSFAQIQSTLQALREGRRGDRPRLNVVMALSRRNHHEASAFAELAASWKLDGFGFLPEHAFVARAAPFDAAEARELTAMLAGLERRADNSPAYLDGIPRFLAGQPTPLECSAPDSHVALDPSGRAYPCVPLMTLERSGVAWRTAGQRPPRPSPDDQKEVCGRCWWNCHRELDLSIGRLPSSATGNSG